MSELYNFEINLALHDAISISILYSIQFQNVSLTLNMIIML